jgi:hypothetical protein
MTAQAVRCTAGHGVGAEQFGLGRLDLKESKERR